ncbi:MAG: hypothetical protein M4D80_34765 [Myxococcota bacterium]|nr:hypothetical protein [Myxococcota bacterium]
MLSGAGCWAIEVDDEAKQLKLFLYAVHTATQMPHLRETPMTHHLKLLAGHARAREAIARIWPELLERS